VRTAVVAEVVSSGAVDPGAVAPRGPGLRAVLVRVLVFRGARRRVGAAFPVLASVLIVAPRWRV